jgi:hypothetical protein
MDKVFRSVSALLDPLIHAKSPCKQYITTFEASIVDRLRFGKHLLHAWQMSVQ